MWVTADTVLVQVDSGSGSTFHERNFEGSGVSDFDATRGANLDVKLREALPTVGVERGSIGKITAVTGSVGCGHQSPGSSSLTITGDTPTGRYERARLDPVLVECYFADGQLTAIGIARAGHTKVLLMVSLGPGGSLYVEEAPTSAPQRYYESRPGVSATLTSNGGHANGEVVEQRVASPHTLHIEGQARCGTPIGS